MKRILLTTSVSLLLTITLVFIVHIFQTKNELSKAKIDYDEFKSRIKWNSNFYDYEVSLHEGRCNSEKGEYYFTDMGGEPWEIQQYLNNQNEAYGKEFTVRKIVPIGFLYNSYNGQCLAYDKVEKLSKNVLKNIFTNPADYTDGESDGRRWLIKGDRKIGWLSDGSVTGENRSKEKYYLSELQGPVVLDNYLFTSGEIDGVKFRFKSRVEDWRYIITENKEHFEEAKEESRNTLIVLALIASLLSGFVTWKVIKV